MFKKMCVWTQPEISDAAGSAAEQDKEEENSILKKRLDEITKVLESERIESSILLKSLTLLNSQLRTENSQLRADYQSKIM